MAANLPDPPIKSNNVGLAGAFLLVIVIITAWLASNKRLRPLAGLFLLTLFLGTLVYQWPYLTALFGATGGGGSGTHTTVPGYSAN